MDFLDAAELEDMQEDVASSLYMTGDLWRMSTAGRRVEDQTGVSLIIYPGGEVDLNDSALGTTGQNSVYIGIASRGLDVRENDQWRNVRLPDDTLFMDRYNNGVITTDGLRFTIGTVEKWPTVIRMRIHEEGT